MGAGGPSNFDSETGQRAAQGIRSRLSVTQKENESETKRKTNGRKTKAGRRARLFVSGASSQLAASTLVSTFACRPPLPQPALQSKCVSLDIANKRRTTFLKPAQICSNRPEPVHAAPLFDELRTSKSLFQPTISSSGTPSEARFPRAVLRFALPIVSVNFRQRLSPIVRISARI